MSTKHAFIFLTLAGTPLMNYAMEKNKFDDTVKDVTATTDQLKKQIEEQIKKNEEKQKTLLNLVSLAAQNSYQKDRIAYLEKEVLNLNSNLLFWRTPAIITGILAATYAALTTYEWWIGKDSSNTFSSHSINNHDEQNIEPSAPELEILDEEAENKNNMPTGTPPGNQEVQEAVVSL